MVLLEFISYSLVIGTVLGVSWRLIEDYIEKRNYNKLTRIK